MSQAKVLTEKEVRKVLLYIASRKHSTRNRAMFVLLNATGMRVERPRESRRLQPLREWSHEQVTQVFP